MDADRASGRNKIQAPPGWLIPTIQENWRLSSPQSPGAQKNSDLSVGQQVSVETATATPAQKEASLAYLKEYEQFVPTTPPEAWITFEKTVAEGQAAGLICEHLATEEQWASNLLPFFSLYENLVEETLLSRGAGRAENS